MASSSSPILKRTTPPLDTKVRKVLNTDACLHVPFLDSMSTFWHFGGTDVQVRNTESIKLVRSGDAIGSYGRVISNGVGDNVIDDFEVRYEFKWSDGVGEGVAFVIAAENNFMKMSDWRSSYGKRQYVLNSGGVDPDNMELMGFPRNLPGLAVVIDTFHENTRNEMEKYQPYLDIFVNVNPMRDHYDLASDGFISTSKRVNKNHIKLKPFSNGIVQLRIIYMESVNFLKVDIQYDNDGRWIELFQTEEDLEIPKNRYSSQRYIGVGSLIGESSGTFELLRIETNEFHTNDEGTGKLSSEQAELFLSEQYGIKKVNAMSRHSTFVTYILWVWKWMLLFVILALMYLTSVYVRVSKKHLTQLRRRRRRGKSVGLLPT